MIDFSVSSAANSSSSYQTVVSGVSQFFSAFGVYNVSGL